MIFPINITAFTCFGIHYLTSYRKSVVAFPEQRSALTVYFPFGDIEESINSPLGKLSKPHPERKAHSIIIKTARKFVIMRLLCVLMPP